MMKDKQKTNVETGIKFIEAETIDGDSVDFDRYVFEDKSQISTKDVSVVVDFINRSIEGDIIAHGDWYDLEYQECLKYLDSLEEKDIIRDFSAIRIETK